VIQKAPPIKLITTGVTIVMAQPANRRVVSVRPGTSPGYLGT
jgi:hypothetical protein